MLFLHSILQYNIYNECGKNCGINTPAEVLMSRGADIDTSADVSMFCGAVLTKPRKCQCFVSHD